MKNGDLSNETPPRLAVHIDVVAISDVVESKKLLRTTVERRLERLNNPELKHLWDLSMKYGLSLELVAYESDHWNQSQIDLFMERLEKRGANPFNYAEVHRDVFNFIDELPYRGNFKGIVDVPGRVAMYGSWGLEITNL